MCGCPIGGSCLRVVVLGGSCPRGWLSQGLLFEGWLSRGKVSQNRCYVSSRHVNFLVLHPDLSHSISSLFFFIPLVSIYIILTNHISLSECMIHIILCIMHNMSQFLILILKVIKYYILSILYDQTYWIFKYHCIILLT